ncbi:hypothetical protein HNP55_001093 [Paucibacter oligotrophus]|uniref:Uncharacterized protein n=1 Tax=Roseateles oligotrophus TaxID=1769250 RepID=A0A840L8P4_9BURK|nr:hypothetical protein [Roseateles oligotrophus]MBB4842578.1 hypothetical protein [Roseateles oligotrophus]
MLADGLILAADDAVDYSPDFELQAAAQRLPGNTRYALSLPEKRAFFLESGDVLGQSLVDGNAHTLAAFYSRAITDPDWGLRATWRHLGEDWSNQWDLEEVSPGFAHDNGFVSQAGYRRLTAHLARRAPGRDWAPLGEWSRLPLYELEWQLLLQQSETLSDAVRTLPGGEWIDRKLQPGFRFAPARNSEVWGHLGLDSLRAHSGGRLDVAADRLGRGANLMLEAQLRIPLPRGLGLEWEQRWGEGFVAAPQGGRSLTDRNRQTLLILHLSAQDSVRLIHQATYFERRAELGLFPDAEKTRHRSLVYQHRDGLERVFSLGLSRADEAPAQARGTELFAKALLAWQR